MSKSQHKLVSNSSVILEFLDINFYICERS